MDYTNAMMVWDAVSVRITDVRHRLLIRQQVEEVDENSLFLFIFGKTGRIIVGERIYLLKTSALFHIGRNHSGCNSHSFRSSFDTVVGTICHDFIV